MVSLYYNRRVYNLPRQLQSHEEATIVVYRLMLLYSHHLSQQMKR
jgi:hypothetical protein